MSLKIISESGATVRIVRLDAATGLLDTSNLDLSRTTTIPEGTATGSAQAVAVVKGTPAVGVVTAVDLRSMAGTLDHASVDPLPLINVKGLEIFNDSADVLYLGGGTGGKTAPAVDAWSDTDAGVTNSPFSVDAAWVSVPAGGSFKWTSPAGVATVSANADVLGIEQGAVAVGDFTLLVWGDLT